MNGVWGDVRMRGREKTRNKRKINRMREQNFRWRMKERHRETTKEDEI